MPRCVLIILCVAISCSAQERIGSGEFKGFSKSATEHIISRIDEPFSVSEIRGSVLFQDPYEPLQNVLVEIRGPGSSQKLDV